MKPWSAIAALLLLVCLHAGAASADAPANVGALADSLRQQMSERCAQESARPASAASGAEQDVLQRDLSCTCGPQALDIAFPAEMRARTTTFDAFLARMSGAMNVCVARSVRRLIEQPCAQGTDPFDDEGTSATTTKAHCRCALAELDKAAAADARKAADDASARYASGKTDDDRQPAPIRLLTGIEKTCAPETVKQSSKQ